MGQGTPLALARDRRCQTQEVAQNTAEEVPHKGCCGDTARREGGDTGEDCPSNKHTCDQFSLMEDVWWLDQWCDLQCNTLNPA